MGVVGAQRDFAEIARTVLPYSFLSVITEQDKAGVPELAFVTKVMLENLRLRREMGIEPQEAEAIDQFEKRLLRFQEALEQTTLPREELVRDENFLAKLRETGTHMKLVAAAWPCFEGERQEGWESDESGRYKSVRYAAALADWLPPNELIIAGIDNMEKAKLDKRAEAGLLSLGKEQAFLEARRVCEILGYAVNDRDLGRFCSEESCLPNTCSVNPLGYPSYTPSSL